MTSEEFKTRAKEAYRNKNYDLSLINYTGIKNKVDIICNNKDENGKIHGLFSIRADNVIHRQNGCPICAKEKLKTHRNKSNDAFINDCKKIYGKEHFNFNISDKYINAKTPINIYCNNHNGYIKIAPTHLLDGQGCKICNIINSYNKLIKDINPNIILKFDKIIKDKNSEITIFCEKHGDVKVKIKDILKHPSCPICLKEQELLDFSENFKEKAKQKHENKFSYEKVFFSKTSLQEKVQIYCKRHNSYFTQRAANHLQGQGCPICAKERITSENFREKFYNKYGRIYDIDNITYVKSIDKIVVKCPKHGDFTTTPNQLLSGKRCPKCSGKNLTLDEKIERLNIKHQYKYDYSHITKIEKSTSKIKPFCSKHGEFEISYNHHLNGQGCPLCKSSTLEKIVYDNLLKNNINFIYDKKCDGFNNQRPDFYLPSENIIIECQGRQHFNKYAFTFDKNKDNTFKKQILLDTEKYELAKSKGIMILYFVKHINEDILNNNMFNNIYTMKNTFDNIDNLMNYVKYYGKEKNFEENII